MMALPSAVAHDKANPIQLGFRRMHDCEALEFGQCGAFLRDICADKPSSVICPHVVLHQPGKFIIAASGLESLEQLIVQIPELHGIA